MQLKQNQNINKQGGFSLIELLVALFILVVLSAVLIANFRTNEKQRRVNAAADIVINALRNAQNYTLTSKTINTDCIQNGVNDRAPLNYRVQLDSGTNEAKLMAEDKCGDIHDIEVYKMPERARFKGNGLTRVVNSVATSHEAVVVKFTTPFAVATSATSTFTTAPFSSYQSIVITLESSDASVIKTLIIDGISGRIGEENLSF